MAARTNIVSVFAGAILWCWWEVYGYWESTYTVDKVIHAIGILALFWTGFLALNGFSYGILVVSGALVIVTIFFGLNYFWPGILWPGHGLGCRSLDVVTVGFMGGILFLFCTVFGVGMNVFFVEIPLLL